MYSAQGEYIHEGFVSSQPYFANNNLNSNVSRKSLSLCENDRDCENNQWSCRVLPISFNGSVKTCMPDNQQYRLFNESWQL